MRCGHSSGVALRILGQDYNPAGVWFLTVPLKLLVGPARARFVIINLGVVSASAVLSCLFAEYAARVVFSDVTTTGHASYFTLRWRRENPPVVNRLGFRELEFNRQKSAGTYRIAVIGDSFTYGQGIRSEDRMTEFLSREFSGQNVEILNLGQRGAETADHIITLQKVVLPLEPDFVLLQWLYNDFEADKSGRPTPLRLVPSDVASSWLTRNSAPSLSRRRCLGQGSASIGVC